MCISKENTVLLVYLAKALDIFFVKSSDDFNLL